MDSVAPEAPLPLLVIAGPTASGKSRLGLEVAELLDGEIVSADAVAVYRGLDLGTDKPAPTILRRVPHHLIDVVEPDERFSAGLFVAAASRAIDEIRGRARLPLVVGGSHFYIRALLVGIFPSPPREPRRSRRLQTEWAHDRQAVFARLETIDPAAAARIGPHDRQRILRALDVFEATGVPLSTHWQGHRPAPRFRPLIVAPVRPRDELYARIETRVDRMFASGLVDETRQLLTAGCACEAHALKAIGYRQVVALLSGACDLDAAVAETKQASRKLAKRQLSWLRRQREGPVHWVPPAERGGAKVVNSLWNDHVKG